MITNDLKMGENVFTAEMLYKKAAKLKGLKLYPNNKGYSRPFRTYSITGELLKHLQRHKIDRQERPDNHGVFTLVDNNPQVQPPPGWTNSNYWNFGLKDNDNKDKALELALAVKLELNMRARGIIITPHTQATLVSPTDHSPNFRMFKALSLWDKKPSRFMRELIATSDGWITVSWTELGLGGLRTLHELFNEFTGRNNVIEGLSGRPFDIFSPKPDLAIYVAEPFQPVIMRAWYKQLKEFKDRIVV